MARARRGFIVEPLQVEAQRQVTGQTSAARTSPRGPRKGRVNGARELRTPNEVNGARASRTANGGDAAHAPRTANGRNGRVNTPQPRRTTTPRSRTAPDLPHPRFGWYAGVALMAIFEIIEWPLAIVMMVGHEVAHRAHSDVLRDFAEGIEAGA